MSISVLCLPLHPVIYIDFLKVYYSFIGCMHLFFYSINHNTGFIWMLLYWYACVHMCLCASRYVSMYTSPTLWFIKEKEKGVSAGVLAYVLMPPAKWLAMSQNTHTDSTSISFTLFVSLGSLTFLLLAPWVCLRDSWTDSNVQLCKRLFKCL